MFLFTVVLHSLVAAVVFVNDVNCDRGCPPEWKKKSSTCYKLFLEVKKYQEAQDHCQHFGGMLATAKDDQEFYELNTINYEYHPVDAVWIGLDDREEEGTFKWVDGTFFRSTRSEYRGADGWDDGEPKNEDEDCTILTTSASWNDIRCDIPHRYVCKLEVNSDTDYWTETERPPTQETTPIMGTTIEMQWYHTKRPEPVEPALNCTYAGSLYHSDKCQTFGDEGDDTKYCQTMGGPLGCSYCGAVVRTKYCPVMCGICDAPCGGMRCFNGGRLNKVACECECTPPYGGVNCNEVPCPKTLSLVEFCGEDVTEICLSAFRRVLQACDELLMEGHY